MLYWLGSYIGFKFGYQYTSQENPSPLKYRNPSASIPSPLFFFSFFTSDSGGIDLHSDLVDV